jgi:hypothetical protein
MGLIYTPFALRIFVYCTDARAGSDSSEFLADTAKRAENYIMRLWVGNGIYLECLKAFILLTVPMPQDATLAENRL